MKYTVGSFFAGVGGFDAAFENAGYDVKFAVEWDKNCQNVLRRHFPATKLYGDITAITAADLEPVDVITWGFPCVVAGTPIMTRRGDIPIEKVKVGDLVLTHTDRWKPVIQTMSRKDAPLVRMIGDGVRWLVITPEHPIYASTGEYMDPTWVPAGQMAGKYWAIPQGSDRCGPSTMIHYGQAGFDFAPVRAIEPFGTGEVFNIGVKDDESYVADGVVVHNCQDVSHAGKRKGMVNHDGSLTRSGLFHIALDIITELNPRVHIFENVTGLLSSGRAGFKGEDFEGCLEALGKNGFDCTWITMDSRFFGLAQRRRRIFGLCTRETEPSVAEGYIREVLSQSKGLLGNSPKSPKKGKKAPADAGTGVEGESGDGGDAGGDAIQLGFDLGDSDDGRVDIGSGSGTGGGLGGGSGGLGGGDGGGVNGFRMVAFGLYADDNTASTLKMRDYKDATDLVTEETSAVDCRNLNLFTDVSGTLQSKKSGGYSLNYQNPVLVPNDKERVALAVDAHHDKLSGEISNTLLHHKAGGMSLMAVNPVLVSDARVEFNPSTVVIAPKEEAEAFYITRGKADEVVVSPTLMAGSGPNRHDGRSGSDFTAVLEKQCYPIDIRNATRTTDKSEMNRQGMGVGKDGDPSPTLTNVFVPAVAIEDDKTNG